MLSTIVVAEAGGPDASADIAFESGWSFVTSASVELTDALYLTGTTAEVRNPTVPQCTVHPVSLMDASLNIEGGCVIVVVQDTSGMSIVDDDADWATIADGADVYVRPGTYTLTTQPTFASLYVQGGADVALSLSAAIAVDDNAGSGLLLAAGVIRPELSIFSVPGANGGEVVVDGVVGGNIHTLRCSTGLVDARFATRTNTIGTMLTMPCGFTVTQRLSLAATQTWNQYLDLDIGWPGGFVVGADVTIDASLFGAVTLEGRFNSLDVAREVQVPMGTITVNGLTVRDGFSSSGAGFWDYSSCTAIGTAMCP